MICLYRNISPSLSLAHSYLCHLGCCSHAFITDKVCCWNTSSANRSTDAVTILLPAWSLKAKWKLPTGAWRQTGDLASSKPRYAPHDLRMCILLKLKEKIRVRLESCLDQGNTGCVREGGRYPAMPECLHFFIFYSELSLLVMLGSSYVCLL